LKGLQLLVSFLAAVRYNLFVDFCAVLSGGCFRLTGAGCLDGPRGARAEKSAAGAALKGE